MFCVIAGAKQLRPLYRYAAMRYADTHTHTNIIVIKSFVSTYTIFVFSYIFPFYSFVLYYAQTHNLPSFQFFFLARSFSPLCRCFCCCCVVSKLLPHIIKFIKISVFSFHIYLFFISIFILSNTQTSSNH